jgi:hypothetical protein
MGGFTPTPHPPIVVSLRRAGRVLSPRLDMSMPLQVSVNDESATFFDVYVPLHARHRAIGHVAASEAPMSVAQPIRSRRLRHPGSGYQTSSATAPRLRAPLVPMRSLTGTWL